MRDKKKEDHLKYENKNPSTTDEETGLTRITPIIAN
jgi:hypothetical protein